MYIYIHFAYNVGFWSTLKLSTLVPKCQHQFCAKTRTNNTDTVGKHSTAGCYNIHQVEFIYFVFTHMLNAGDEQEPHLCCAHLTFFSRANQFPHLLIRRDRKRSLWIQTCIRMLSMLVSVLGPDPTLLCGTATLVLHPTPLPIGVNTKTWAYSCGKAPHQVKAQDVDAHVSTLPKVCYTV